jgi:FkbM family methyltransferase
MPTKISRKSFFGIPYWKKVRTNYRIHKYFFGLLYSNQFDSEHFFEDRIQPYLEAQSTKMQNILSNIISHLEKFEKSNNDTLAGIEAHLKGRLPQEILYLTRSAKGHRELLCLYDDFQENYKNILPEKFDALTKGLDNESYSTVVTILNRMQQVAPSPGEFDIFTTAEKASLLQLKEHFQPMVMQLSESLFTYNRYLLPTNRWESCVFYFNSSLNFIKNIDYLRNRDIIDAGAYLGDSALLFSPLTEKNIYSFEPSSRHLDWMAATLKLNNIKNVIVVPLALGSEVSTGELTYSYQGSSLGNPFNPWLLKSKEHEAVNITTLDSYVAEHSLEVGLIKTDLEGFEQPFLRGAVNTIKTQKPILLISIYHSMDDFFNIKPLIESWDLGYEFKIVKPVDGAIILETMLIAEVPRPSAGEEEDGFPLSRE